MDAKYKGFTVFDRHPFNRRTRKFSDDQDPRLNIALHSDEWGNLRGR